MPGPAGPAGEARQGELEIEGHEASGALVCANREWQDLFKCWFRELWDTQEEKGRCVFSVPSLRRRQEPLPSLPTSSVGGVQDVRSLDADNEVHKARSSLLFLSKLLPHIYL